LSLWAAFERNEASIGGEDVCADVRAAGCAGPWFCVAVVYHIRCVSTTGLTGCSEVVPDHFGKLLRRGAAPAQRGFILESDGVEFPPSPF